MSIPKLKKHENGVWYVHWTDGRRSKRESTGTEEVAAAKAYLAQFLLNAASEHGAAGATFTVAELWTIYDKKHVQKEVASPDALRFAWNNLSGHFGTLHPAAIDQSVVDAYEKERAAGRIGRKSKAATVRRELVSLRACLNWAADPARRLLKPEHIPAFKLPSEGPPRDRWLKTDEIQKLLKAAESFRRADGRMSRAERFIWLALETAGRKSALLELTWDRVDFETGVIHLNVPGRALTKKRRADVPISNALRPVLQRAYAERVNEFVLDHQAAIWRQIQLVVLKAGLSAPQKLDSFNGPKGTGVSPHVFRHTAATHMARRGVPLWIIAKVLGNTIAMVEKVYAKHCPDDLRAAVNSISGAPANVFD